MPDPIAAIKARLDRNRWIDDRMPQMPTVDALPTASAQLAYRIIAVRGTPDVSYQCLRDAGGDWDWRVIATG